DGRLLRSRGCPAWLRQTPVPTRSPGRRRARSRSRADPCPPSRAGSGARVRPRPPRSRQPARPCRRGSPCRSRRARGWHPALRARARACTAAPPTTTAHAVCHCSPVRPDRRRSSDPLPSLSSTSPGSPCGLSWSVLLPAELAHSFHVQRCGLAARVQRKGERRRAELRILPACTERVVVPVLQAALEGGPERRAQPASGVRDHDVAVQPVLIAAGVAVECKRRLRVAHARRVTRCLPRLRLLRSLLRVGQDLRAPAATRARSE